MRIQQLPNDVMITGLSNLSKGVSYKDWLVGVNYKHKTKLREKEEQSEFKNLKFSNMPMLAKGRIYNTTEPTNLYHKTANFTINNLNALSSLDDFYFETIIDIIYEKKLYEQIKVKIPKLELARVLFFHNAYLATSALQERVLDIDFLIKQDNSKNIITVLPHCSLAKTLFEELGFRSKLSWLLLNSNIKTSYYSIYQNLEENKTQGDKYDKWKFNFTPPPLINLSFKVKGYLNNIEILYVDEVLSISGIDSGIEGEVEFLGNLFTQEVTTQDGIEILTQFNNTKEPSISDDYEANSDMPVQIIETPQVEFEFISPIRSLIKPIRITTKAGAQSKNDESSSDIKDVHTLTVATNEPTIEGNAPKGEFQNNEDITNRDTQYRQNFIALIEAVEKLNLENFILNYYKLPKVSRCRLYLKPDRSHRVLLQAMFQYKNQSFMVFEVDTTDLEKKRLSTLIVKGNYEISESDELLEEIVRTSLSWSKLPFSKKINLNHPKEFYIGSSNTQNMIEGWSNRILQSLENLRCID